MAPTTSILTPSGTSSAPVTSTSAVDDGGNWKSDEYGVSHTVSLSAFALNKMVEEIS
jgi:hypothetical protein